MASKIFRIGVVDNGLMFALRVCLLSLALVTATAYTYEVNSGGILNWSEAYTGLAILFGFSILSGFWILNRKSSTQCSRLGFVVDSLVVTTLIYFTGGSFSPLLFLYLPLVMLAVVLVSRNFAFTLSIISLGMYYKMLQGLDQGWLPAITNDQNLQLSPEKLNIQLLGLASGVFLVVLGAEFLKNKLGKYWDEIQRANANIDELVSFQDQMINEIPAGLVVTDLNSKIIKANQVAAQLLEVNKSDLIGQNFQDLLEKRTDSANKINVQEQSNFELGLKKNDGSLMKVSYSRSAIRENSEFSECLHVLQDITIMAGAQDKLDLQEKMAQLLSMPNLPLGKSHPKLIEFVGESTLMQEVFRLIQRTAPSHANVLISGESGTGKELVAKAIHLDSLNAAGPFVAVNCGAIPENLIEGALFGHVKGSFTGAVSDQTGYFVQANKGTLFLDEIGELPFAMQAKLLRVIQERVVRPIGGKEDLPINVRIVSATNKNLAKEVENGTFREDLFYRLNVISIALPALRERKSDIPVLVNAILKRLISSGNIPIVSPPAMDILMKYNYPGNVRELENILERALVLGGEAILPQNLPEFVRVENANKPKTEIIISDEVDLPTNLDDVLAKVERKYLERAMLLSRGLRKSAAEMLGINFRSLRYRLDKFGEDDWWNSKKE